LTASLPDDAEATAIAAHMFSWCLRLLETDGKIAPAQLAAHERSASESTWLQYNRVPKLVQDHSPPPQALSHIQRLQWTTQNDFAWFLANCRDVGSRNPGRALPLALNAVNVAPDVPDVWNTLGAAHYRLGNWPAALEALDKAVRLGNGGTSWDFFFLAMTHHQLANHDLARAWYGKAIAWLETHPQATPENSDLRALRKEAEALGIPEGQDAKSREDGSGKDRDRD
jgi:tetratricopeptide (TPR) repeat protein